MGAITKQTTNHQYSSADVYRTEMVNPASREYQLAVIEYQRNLIELLLYQLRVRRRNDEQRRKRSCWVRPWIARRHLFGVRVPERLEPPLKMIDGSTHLLGFVLPKCGFFPVLL